MKYRVKIKNPVIGVPITWLDKFSTEQFEIIGADEAEGTGFSNGLHVENTKAQCLVNGNKIYKRIFIRWKTEAMPTIDEDGVILYG